MFSSKYLRALTALLWLACLAPPVAAQTSDIDIFSGVSSTSDRPNVLFILDNSANWSSAIPGAANCYYKDNGVATTAGPTADQGTKLGIEKCALYNLVDALPVSSTGDANNNALFNLGLMLMNESANGGYPRQRFLPVTTNNKVALKAAIVALDKTSDKTSNSDFGLTVYEAYLYYKGLAPLNGTLGTKWDHAAVSGGKYVTPAATSCARNYVIFIANGSPQTTTAEKSVQALLATRVDADFPTWTAAARQVLKTQIDNSATLGSLAANWSDEMSRLMRQTDVSGMESVQGVITHTVAVIKGPSDGAFPPLMKSMASQGGGNYYEATSADALVKGLLDIFNQLQSVNSGFASATLPVALNARGSYLNQVYLGMFRPDGSGKPRWRGNLKQYRFGLDSADSLSLTDANGNAAITASSGFMNPSAVSYWTAVSNFWMNDLMGTPQSASDSPDGEVVEKGGAAQHLRTTFATAQTSRNVYTCVGCANGTTLGSSDATRFADANGAITQAMLGVSSASDRTNLINWLRGTDNAGDELVPTTSPVTTVRPSIHGDVLHSRPAVLNFGGTTGVIAFYGTNDGQLRAVNGNPSGTGAGEELWSFVPQEHFGKLNRLRSNTPKIKLSTTPAVLDNLPRDYFVDGPIGSYQQRTSSGTLSRAIIYVGMRRGGRQLYAIDVTTPTQPKFLWKVTNATAGMGLLGQTWSEPITAQVKGVNDPVLVFGAGYDASAEDGGAATTMGNAVFVLNALTGELLKTFTSLSGSVAPASIGRSIPADVALLDSDYDGKVDRGYAVDLGGQVYRVDFETTAGNLPANWTIYKLADLSGGTSTGRKFFFGPDILHTKDFTALMFGSGDREKPLLNSTQDHFFEIFDRRKDKGPPLVATPIVWSTLTAMGETPSIAGNGCYMALAQGEKVVNAASSIAGFSYFGTNRPSAPSSGTTCSANLGVAKSYAMPLFCVAAVGDTLTGGGLPPSPVAGIVVITRSDGTTVQVPFVIGAPNAKHSAIEGSRLTPAIDAVRKRRYWFQETQR